MTRRRLVRRLALALGLAVFVPTCLAPRASAQEQPAPAAAAAGAQAQQQAKPVVAVFQLSGPLTESPAGEAIPLFSVPGTSLREFVERMDKAAKDPNVKAVVVMADGGSAGVAQIEELRQAMGRVRAAGKDVLVHSDSMGMGEYVLYSAASRVSVTPHADLWLTGVGGEQVYVRGLLDLLGVKPDFFTCGDYKSAAEMFMRDGPTPEADRMTNWLFDSLYDTLVNAIAQGRNLPPERVRALIDEGPYTARSAKEAGLIDAVEHRQDFEAGLKAKYGADLRVEKKYGQPKGPDMDFSSPFALFKVWADILGAGQKPKDNSKPAVAIVYVEGPIMEGSGDSSFSPFGMGAVAASSDIRRALEKAANDDSVKAVVLRVDSPGGSAVASEIILDATKRVRAKKPFVVSMGNVAGSGGYYVACGSDTIFADESTITASIGVVAGKFKTNDMWRKAGITFKEYKRGKNAGLLSTSDTFNDAERQKMMAWMEEVYGTFKGHVTAARGDRLKKPIDELAGGRVFTGRQALDLGLIDRIGTMSDAIAHVAGKADLQEGAYEVRTVPQPKNLIELLLDGGGADDEPGIVGLPANGLKASGGTSLAELALPHLRHLDPRRVEAVMSALRRLEMLQKDGVLLTTPEILIAGE